MKLQTILILLTVVLVSWSFAFSVWTVNHEDTARMEIAAQNGYVQCDVNHTVLWKQNCEK